MKFVVYRAGMGKMVKLKKLLHAPFTLHSQLMNFIENEIVLAKAGKPAKIIIKVNALTEVQLINKLLCTRQKKITH